MSHRLGLPWFLVLLAIVGRSHGRSSLFQNKKQSVVPIDRQIVLSRGNTNSYSSTSSLVVSSSTSDSNLFGLLSVRGGATKEIDLESSDGGSGLIVRKLRHMIRSCLSSADQSSPALSKILKSFISVLEKVIGVRLLPPENSKGRKSKRKVQAKEHSETEKPASKTKTNVKQPKKKSKNTSSGSSTKNQKVATKNSASPKPKVEAPETKASPSRTLKSKSNASPPAAKTETPKSKASPPKSNANKSAKAAAVSAKAKAHLAKPLKSTSPNYRIQRELKSFLQDPPDNLTVKVGKNIRVWIVKLTGAANTIYEGETFMLRISFPKEYPTVPPSVYFLPPNIPVHEHVYTNGDICLSLLGKGWRPTMTAQSIAISILSILSSAQSKSLPMDNSRHALNKPGEYQEAWIYHDDGTLCYAMLRYGLKLFSERLRLRVITFWIPLTLYMFSSCYCLAGC